ncbi:Vitamin B12 transporter BtuB [Pseudoalteromonas holothuriae]|uniref:Vitamin B12 transporter BtuB n=1 Tax=Pseudoalteromonas holothuriae TaxID=2963714 RepID=A0A9W4R4P1_9GAMM|nr:MULTISPECIES: TonB-dependent receptor [unclassified Pseudoalteromonas]CAH9067048.1 Vitamin B12 transporter BtuB [Pseudoalteromonas sp. CIP111854]CAH9068175.1 Vitamin B12 transporter BtuB [Pseudoalteromonas sp. CIP111951]
MLNSKVSKAVRLAIAFGATSTAAFSASSAIAAEEESAESFEKIQVTGSRIKRADMEGANPVQLITRDDLVASGISNVGDILQEIPSVAGAGTNAAINNGGAGAVRVSLRGLGSERTLVLLNGRRVVASGSGANASVDLSTIPTAIIKRVEVLKDGASAIYGSDAIGGVVNIITRDDFEGFEANAMYDASTHGGDGETKSYDFTVGFSGDKGNVVFNAYYTEYGAQMSGDRSWSEFELDLDPETGDFNKGGSSAPPWGRYNGINPDVEGACNSFTHGAGSGPGQSDPSDFSNATGYDCWDWDKDTYNYAPSNFHLTPSERYGIFAQANYEFSDSLRFFTEINFNRRSSDTKLAPLPLAPLAFFGWTDATYSKDNYYNQQFGPKNVNGETVDIADWRRRVVETGGRDTTFRVETVRAVFGFEGEINDTWGYEVSYIFGRNDGATNRAGGVNFEKVNEAVGPSFMEGGEVFCGTPGNVIEGCVSLNTFGTPGTDTQISEEMLDFISFEAHDLGYNEQQIISASIFGDAFELPAGTVGVAFGAEHREEKGADFPDALIALGITSGSPRKATQGSYSVDELYMETNVPLLSGAPMAEVLELDLAVRYSDYDTFGDTTNHKVGIRWSPMDGLMFRGTSSTAFRAPSTLDLFQGASANSPLVSDPCQANPTQFCIADGVPAGGFEPIGDQLSSTRGGNVNLQPEEADITTIGVVYSPEFVEGLSFTIDYWDIELENAITTIGEQLILDKCANEGVFCDKITRYTSGGLVGNSSDIDDRKVNVGGIDSSGIDFNMRYATDTEYGALTFNLDSTRYDTYDITQADGSVVENAGWFRRNSGDGNFPEWKTNIDVRLAQDDWSAGYAIRYIGEVEEPFGNTAGQRTVDSQTIHDIRFSYFFDNFTTTVGVDNVFDEDPPYAATGFNDNTDPRTYNTLGRHVYLSLGVAF